ncbi:DNA-processing protein DprA [Flavobacterium selenitireducens]|uniref:DNA-processing protein DprA n=1 Tax=Flavobacterium selenitireducens TaxID=2722704 RepID=UPI00168BDE8E|nr:DNA-processing protein DprA [Flavobacterium selenitireducens]MBD3581627.1 DNA-protecting protein DprA [Flavobacterium selenitireducens]
MRHTELVSVLALQKVEGVGDVIAKKLMSHFGSAEEIFASDPKKLSEIEGINPRLANRFKDRSVFAKAEAEAKQILQSQTKVTTFLDPEYPERLKHCHDGPLMLFSTGNINLENRMTLSIVGTRKATAYGADFCRRLVADLAVLDPVIISGFAYGIDIIAHQAALDNGLQTIAVLGSGLDQIYPNPHKKYVNAINANGGFMTEFWSGAYPAPENFVRRNRIVAGISQATVIIESAERGGSLITANLANDYNRDVFALPGRITDALSQGCNQLIKTQRAHLLTGAADLLYILNWDLKPQSQSVQKQLFVSLDASEQRIYDYLVLKKKELLDTIAIENEMPVSKLSALLFSLELKGVVRPLPGKAFEAI